MMGRRWLGSAAVVYCILVLAALVPIGSNTNTVDGRQEIDWWTLGSLLVGVVISGDPIELNRATWAILAALLAGLGVVGAGPVVRRYRVRD